MYFLRAKAATAFSVS